MIRSGLIACAIVTVGAFAAAKPPVASDRQIADFALIDYRGQRHALSDYKASKVVVIVFLGTECPIVQLYADRLQALYDKYHEQGVTFLGIDANQQDSLAELEHLARTHKLTFPLLKDPGNRVADLFKATRTPEVFVLGAHRAVKYHGRIDDQYTYETQRNRAEKDYLLAAIHELLAGQPVATPETEAVGCHIGREFRVTKDNGVTYANQISRILQRRCEECHREGEIGPFALTEYDEVAGWAEMIEEVVRQERMPPWHASSTCGDFANDRRMSEPEKEVLYQWVRDGAPLGNPAQLPTPKHYVSGWQLPKQPDLVLHMRDAPYTVAAKGTIRYQYFVVDPDFTEDKWIQMAEVLPGNRKVVHHILVFAQTPGGQPLRGEMGGFLAAYVPGLRAAPFPPGMAKRVRAGSKLIFQVHYTPVGTEQTDFSAIGLVFAKRSDITHEVVTAAAVNTRFAIPPHNDDFRVEATSRKAPTDVLLLALMPHMHLRGKSFRYEAVYPNGTAETLLEVPQYDFNWQTAYRLSRPKPIPAGTAIHCVAHFDNSEDNLANPDPERTVRWGEQTWDEMMIGYMDVARPLKPREE